MVRFIIALNLVNKEDVDYIKSCKTSLSEINYFKINIDKYRVFKVNGFKVFNLTNGIIENLSLEDAINKDSGIQWVYRLYRFDTKGYAELNCFGDLIDCKSGTKSKDMLMFSYEYEIFDIYPRYFYLSNYDVYSLSNLPISILIDLNSEEFYLGVGGTKVYNRDNFEDNEPIMFVSRNYQLSMKTDFERFYRPVSNSSYCLGDVFVVNGGECESVCIMPSDCKKCVVGSGLINRNISIVLHPNVKSIDVYYLDNSCRLNLFISSETAEQVVNMVVRKWMLRQYPTSGFESVKGLADKLCSYGLGAIDYLKDYNVYIELY